MLLSTFN